MAIKTFENCKELHDWVGKEVAVTDWLTVTQQRIDDFAKASNDYQWIHVDPERAPSHRSARLLLMVSSPCHC